MTRPATINSLSRGAQILRLLSAGGALGVTEVAERLHVDPSTAYRLLVTLEGHGLVAQERDSKKYAIGYGILEIAAGLLRQVNVVEVAQAHLRALAAATGESAHIAVRNGNSAISVGSESATGILRVETAVGNAEPLHCTAVGKALLVDHTPDELRSLFLEETLQRFTPQTITDIEELVADIGRARRAGFAYDDEELHPGVRCIASPVRDYTGRIIAALGISMPAIRMTRERSPEIGEHVRRAADAVSLQLGYPGTSPDTKLERI